MSIMPCAPLHFRSVCCIFQDMKKLLLASSSPSFLERNRHLLKRTDVPIFTAATGQEALLQAREESVELIVSEMKLDDMWGDELCALVLTEHLDEPVKVVLVCHDTPEELERARRSGANICLTRPLQPLQLLETVGHLLNTSMVRNRRVSVRARVMGRKERLEFHGWSRDVSVSGILLEAGERLVIGDRIWCRFSLSDSSPIEVEGEVVRSVRALDGEHRYGVRFINLAPDFSREIDSFIASQDRDEG